VKYASDSLPEWVDRSKPGIWRYWRLLPIMDPGQCTDLGEGATPLFKADKLGEVLGLRNLWVKDESRNPTATFKVREAGLTFARFREIGVHEFVVCSTGNTAAGFVRGASRFSELTLHLLIPLLGRERINFHIPSNVRAGFVGTDYFRTMEIANEYATHLGIAFEGGFENPCRRESMKAISFEIFEAGVRPDFYVQSVGSGVGPYGVHKGFTELEKTGMRIKPPHLVCVQPENCAPIVEAYRRGLEDLPPDLIVPTPNTMASTIANGNPKGYRYLKPVLDEACGIAEAVTEKEIVDAKGLVRLERLNSEPAALVAVAGLKKVVESGYIDRSDVVVLNNSGGYRNGPPKILSVFSTEDTPLTIYRGLTGGR